MRKNNIKEIRKENLVFEYPPNEVWNLERVNGIFELSKECKYFRNACIELGCTVVSNEKINKETIRIPRKITLKQLELLLPNENSFIRPSTGTFWYDRFQFTRIRMKRNKRGHFAGIEEDEIKRIDKIINKIIGRLRHPAEQRKFFKSSSPLYVQDDNLIIPKEVSIKGLDIALNTYFENMQKIKDSYLPQNKQMHTNVKTIKDFQKKETIKDVDNETFKNRINNKQHTNGTQNIKQREIPNNPNPVINNESPNNKIDNFPQRDIKLKEVYNPERTIRPVNKVNRVNSLVFHLKKMYDDTCQICGDFVDLGYGERFSEVHHIRPLGGHNGTDSLGNMIVVCPNHHSMFDRGAITINLTNKRIFHVNPSHPLNNNLIILKHELSESNISYHDTHIFKKNNEKQYKSSSRSVDFGNKVIIQDVSTNETFNLEIEPYYQREFMSDLQKALIGCAINAEVSWDSYRYRVIEVI